MASELERRRGSAVDAARPDARTAIKMLGLSPDDPKAHALMLVCQRYDLDPFLGHVTIYKDGGLYIHKDAYVHLANQHPAYEGYRILRQWEDEKNWWAEVEVYKRGWRVPSVGQARSAKNKPKKNGQGTYFDEDADEKAVSKALRRALKRAFNVDWPHPEYNPAGEPVETPGPVTEVVRRVAAAEAEAQAEVGGPPPDAQKEYDPVDVAEDEIDVDPETGEVLQDPADAALQGQQAADIDAAGGLDEHGWPPEPESPTAGSAVNRPAEPAGPTLPEWAQRERAQRGRVRPRQDDPPSLPLDERR